MVFEKVRAILAEQLDIDEEKITEDTDIVEDLGADSLDVVELMMTLEQEFDLLITDEKVSEFRTVGDVVDYIESLI
ncbi:MAG TPA: acyl carrier protein [Clostridiales bacterium]|jgi:acyl carrier protein|nr:acyl carrier protein [Clostridiales bacterium]